MTTVIYIKGLDLYPDRIKLAGIADFARQHDWNLQSVESISSSDQLRSIIDLWSPAGIIVSRGGGRNTLPPSDYGTTPVVFLTFPNESDMPSINRVYNDARTTARLAAKTLLKYNLESYGYVNWFKPVSWNESRRLHFEKTLALHGKPIAAFSAGPADELHFTKALIDWLRALPKPTGLFAASDSIARLVANACKLSSLAVPDDVVILGVDNDEDLCELTSPTLSSIRLNHFKSGQLAARLLNDLMTARVKAPVDVTYPCAEIVHRESTRRFTNSDRLVSELVERIRKEACSGISAEDIVASAPCSRRTIEVRFRKATGKSILEEIRSVRLQKAHALLKARTHDMLYVAHQVGYATLPAFSAFFKAETGLSPRAWQKQACQQTNQD